MSLVGVTGREEKGILSLLHRPDPPPRFRHPWGWCRPPVGKTTPYVVLADVRGVYGFIRKEGGGRENRFHRLSSNCLIFCCPPPLLPIFYVLSFVHSGAKRLEGGEREEAGRGRKEREEGWTEKYHGNATIVRRKSLMREVDRRYYFRRREVQRRNDSIEKKKEKGWSNERSRESKFDLWKMAEKQEFKVLFRRRWPQYIGAISGSLSIFVNLISSSSLFSFDENLFRSVSVHHCNLSGERKKKKILAIYRWRFPRIVVENFNFGTRRLQILR